MDTDAMLKYSSVAEAILQLRDNPELEWVPNTWGRMGTREHLSGYLAQHEANCKAHMEALAPYQRPYPMPDAITVWRVRYEAFIVAADCVGHHHWLGGIENIPAAAELFAAA